MERFTAGSGAADLRHMLAAFDSDPGCLVILNHPYWDQPMIGSHLHDALLEDFMESFRPWIHALEINGLRDYRFEIVGHGAESERLRSNLRLARLPGVVLGRDLAIACADMDVSLFPSRTDTYGNVVWEASASGVPSIVTDSGGPQYIVRNGETGVVTRSDEEFVNSAVALYRARALRTGLGARARAAAFRQSWDAVFDQLYAEAYEAAVAA